MSRLISAVEYEKLCEQNTFEPEVISKKLEEKLEDMKSSVKSIQLDADALPPHIKEILDGLTEGKTRGTAIDGDTLPQELKDFLKKMAEEQENDEDDD